MSEDVARRFIDALNELEETGDAEAIADCFAEDCEVGNIAIHKLYHGREGAYEFWNKYREAFDQVKSTFRNVIVSGNKAALEWSSKGRTLKGDQFDYCGVTILEISGDEIKRCEAYFDVDNLSRQMGVHR